MKIFNILVFLTIVLFYASPALRADTLHTKTDILKNTTVKAIHSDKVEYIHQKKQQSIPLQNISHIEFDAYTVIAKTSGIILKDGTRLCGLIRKVEENVEFRSTSLGRQIIPADDIAVFYYDAYQNICNVLEKYTDKCVVEKSGDLHKGKILWADSLSCGIMTSKGLRKIDASDLAFVRFFSSNNKKQTCQLRNGDILNTIDSFNGTSITVITGKRKYKVPIKAISKLNCTL